METTNEKTQDFKKLQEEILATPNKGDLSDGYHSYNELYHHRGILFAVICKQNKDKSFKSLKHADGSMFEGFFVVGLDTPDGQFTYHYSVEEFWDIFKDVPEVEFAPEWDGHTPDDITRLLSL